MRKRVIISSVITNCLVWYDYALYGLLSTVLSTLFFPESDHSTALIATYGIFAAGFVMRPLGAIAFGYIGDRYGRQVSLVISTLLMALPTATIGLLPTYADIGSTAPLLLTLLRLLQGLSLGGTSAGSMAFAVEHASDKYRGFAGSSTLFGVMLGILAGSAVSSITAHYTGSAFNSWGWRIPFIFGLVAGLASLYIRTGITESPKYIEAKTKNEISSVPFKELLQAYIPEIFQTIGICLLLTVPFYVITVFLITLMEMQGHSHEAALTMNTISMAVALLFIPISGIISDYIGRKRTMLVSAAGFLIGAIPIFWLLCQPGFALPLIGQILFAVLLGGYIGPLPAILVEIFPTRVRYTGMSFSSNFCIALFGGTTPLILTALIRYAHEHTLFFHFFNINTVPAFYVILSSVISLVALLSYKDCFKEPLR